MKPFRVIIAGGRDFMDYELLSEKLDIAFMNIPYIDLEIVEGGAKGADAMGKMWAIRNKVGFKTFEADWNTYGKAAGPKRNKEMAVYATHLVAFWDGTSRGTRNMIDTAHKQGLKVRVVYYKPTPKEEFKAKGL